MTMKRNKHSPLTARQSRALPRRTFLSRPLTKSRAYNIKPETFRRTVIVTPRIAPRAMRPINSVKQIKQALVAMRGVNATKAPCTKGWSKILSWRSDQKQSGGRKRAPRSQREKAASAAKHFKDC